MAPTDAPPRRQISSSVKGQSLQVAPTGAQSSHESEAAGGVGGLQAVPRHSKIAPQDLEVPPKGGGIQRDPGPPSLKVGLERERMQDEEKK